MFEQFQCHVFEDSQEFWGCHCARENRFQRKKTEARPLGEQEVATRCLRWHSARGIAEWFCRRWPGPQAGVREHRGGGFSLGCGLGKVGGYVGLGTPVKPL